jgi:hypothetical protein
MNKRQRERTNKLIQFIKDNPKRFSQWEHTDCIIGLGNRLVRGKLAPHQKIHKDYFGMLACRAFGERYGISETHAIKLYDGRYNEVNRRQKPARIFKSNVKSAVSVLTYLTKQ